MLKPLLIVAMLLALPALAGKGPAYRYGDAWWHEYRVDDNALLLLHFGPPTVTGNEKVKEAIDEQTRDEELIDLDEVDTIADSAGLPGIGIEAMTPGRTPVDDANVPPTVAVDYSDQRRRLKLPEGMRTVPDAGRFGGGLVTTGKTGLEVRFDSSIEVVETHFKVDALPEQTVCLLAIDDNVSRLLLHPDGRLELKLAKPHGEPGADPNTKQALSQAELDLIYAKDPTITSPPITVGEWHHVAIWNRHHPTPGGGEPWDARITLNGTVVDNYLSERYNRNAWLGGRRPTLIIGDRAGGGQPFRGILDELRVSSARRVFYERPPMLWRDAELTRPLQFDRPWFREDATRQHASLDHGTELSRGDGTIALRLKGADAADLQVPGIRGSGWVVDPRVGFPRIPLEGVPAIGGSLEFWLRPVNWDDVTGYWHHSPPVNKELSVARVIGRHKESGEERAIISVELPRAHNIERGRRPIDPGHWGHYVVRWNQKGAWVHHDTRYLGRARIPHRLELADYELLHLEFGVSDDATVARMEPPLIEIDEVVTYSVLLAEDEIKQARARWQGELQPIPLYNDSLQFKWSLQKLEYAVKPLLPDGQVAGACTVRVEPIGATHTLEPREDGSFFAILHEGEPLPEATYTVSFTLSNAAGEPLAEGSREWTYEEEPWRHNTAGILTETPPPWTPITIDGEHLDTRMTRYTLAPNGLPAQIRADGTEILAGPILLQEGSADLAGTVTARPTSNNVDAAWRSSFTGDHFRTEIDLHAEYDGMLKFTIRPRPTGAPATLRMVIPIKGRHATRALYYPMGKRGVSNMTLPAEDGTLLSSRAVFKNDYGFFGHLDINDMDRGLWWFCDNAAGWLQSKEVPAIAIERDGDTVNLVLNLIAEAQPYESTEPIVFAILPHPARPMPAEYRLYDRVSPRVNDRASNIFDAFRPWPLDPRDHAMKLYPRPDPDHPEAGPSWDFAESCIPYMKSAMPHGLRTMYLSRLWFSCRAGQYDHWEWRSGDNGGVSLTPSFVNYLCWEMDEWIGRGIWEAIYLDECYEIPATNLEAGFSVRLPDGREQPGVTNFQFRELMKRWRNIFHQHGKEPILIGHHTYSWQYHGLVFCDAYLDGENRPIVSLTSRDWIDSTGRTAFENIQNGELWGMASFYMPFIAEGGFDNKSKSEFPAWQWRMARQAQSEFAHYEVATVYEGQGAQVYKAYWRDLLGWGVGDPATVTFHPYWRNGDYLSVADQGGPSYVSFYRKPDGESLFLVSNHQKEQRDIAIELDLQALGLTGPLEAVPLDSAFDPPPGDDFIKETAGKAPEPELSLEDDLAGDFDLEGPGEIAAKQAQALVPRLAGNRLIVPTRPRDYRVIILRPAP